MVECQLPKLNVAGSSPVSRSKFSRALPAPSSFPRHLRFCAVILVFHALAKKCRSETVCRDSLGKIVVANLTPCVRFAPMC